MKVTFSEQKKPTKQVGEEKCTTPSKYNASRRQSVTKVRFKFQISFILKNFVLSHVHFENLFF